MARTGVSPVNAFALSSVTPGFCTVLFGAAIGASVCALTFSDDG